MPFPQNLGYLGVTHSFDQVFVGSIGPMIMVEFMMVLWQWPPQLLGVGPHSGFLRLLRFGKGRAYAAAGGKATWMSGHGPWPIWKSMGAYLGAT